MPNPPNDKSLMDSLSSLEIWGMFLTVAGLVLCIVTQDMLVLIGLALIVGGMNTFAIGNAARWIIATQITIHSK